MNGFGGKGVFRQARYEERQPSPSQEDAQDGTGCRDGRATP